MADPVPFNQLAAGFDQNMPAELYDQARKHYFDTVVVPRLDRGSSHLAAWEHFKQGTERKSTLSTSGKIALPAAQFVSGFAHALTKPLSSVMPEVKPFAEGSEKAEKELAKTASREGRSQLPLAAGEMAGSLAPIALAAETGGATLEMGGLEAGTTAYKLLRGGIAFGAFEAAYADEGHRLTAGVKGFGTGLAFEGALGLAGKLTRRGIPQSEVDKIVTNVLSGEKEASPEIDHEITQSVKKDAQVSKQEGRPQFVKEDPTSRGVSVLLHDANKQAITLKVKSGNEHAIVKQVLDITAGGGAVDGIIHHPNDVALANRFMKISADVGAQRYEGAKVIRTEQGQASKIALEDQLDGHATEAVSGDKIVVQTPKRATPTGPEIIGGVKQLRDEDGYELSLGAQGSIAKDVRRLWRNDVPDANKEVVARRLSSWDLKDLIPDEWRREKEIPGSEEVTPEVGEIEQLRRQEVEEHEPSRFGEQRFEKGLTSEEGPKTYSGGDTFYEGKVRKGRAMKKWAEEKAKAAQPQAMHNILIPPSEEYMVGYGPGGSEEIPLEPGYKLGVTPRRFGIQVSKQTLQRTMPGAAALTHPPEFLDPILERLGLRKTGYETERLPAIAYESPHRAFVYHEGLHVDKYHIPDGERIIQSNDLGQELTTPLQKTVAEVSQGLRKHGVYSEMDNDTMREEAFVHSATAIRMGDANYLAEITKMDGSINDIFNMVNDRAMQLLRASMSGVDSAPVRVLQRKMSDLILRTTPNKSFELMDQTSRWLSDSWYDPEARRWNFKTPEAEEGFDSFHDLANHIDKQDGASWAPSATLFAEARGVRGPIVPHGGGPVQDPVAMDTPPDTRWSGWTSISGWFRPMGPWVNDLHVRVNDALSSTGRKLPIYDRWKDVDEAFRNGDNWLQDNYSKSAKLLEGLGKKQYDYFNVLTTDPKHWPEMAKQFNFNQADLDKLGKLDEWLGNFRDDTNILVKNYLRDEFPRLRSMGYNTEMVYGTVKKTPEQMSTFERLIRSGKLDPKSAHLGSFIDTMLREGFSKKFTDKPLKELEKLVEAKAKDGSYMLGNMRHPLVNYTRYMRGIPDVTGQIMNKSVTEFFNFLGEKGKEMNKHLPSYAQLPEKFEYPRSYINKLMVWSYAAGLGLRAAIPIRDAMQVFSTVLPVLGPAKFARGLKRFAEEGFTFADEQGALLKKLNIGELYGDIFNELPPGASTDRITKLANKLLSPSRWGHNIGRAIGFYGEYDSALEGVRAARAGRASAEDLINDHSSLWWNDKPVQERIIGQLHDSGFSDEEIARNIALETTDLTLWPYRRGTQPTILRTGMGRVFGQFGMWPMNYFDFLRRGATKFGENPVKAMQTTGMWAASNYAAVAAMNGIGADAGKWFWFSPAAIEMSPHAKFVEDLAGMWKDSPDGREARKRVLEYPLDFFPTSIEAQNILKVIKSGEEPFDDEGHPTPALLQVLGFKPLKDEPDRSIGDEVEHQLGFGNERTRH